MADHYAFMMKVATVREPKTFAFMMKVTTVCEPETLSEAAKDPKWVEASIM